MSCNTTNSSDHHNESARKIERASNESSEIKKARHEQDSHEAQKCIDILLDRLYDLGLMITKLSNSDSNSLGFSPMMVLNIQAILSYNQATNETEYILKT